MKKGGSLTHYWRHTGNKLIIFINYFRQAQYKMKNELLNSVDINVGISEQLPLLSETKKDKVSPQMSPDIKIINVRSHINHNFGS